MLVRCKKQLFLIIFGKYSNILSWVAKTIVSFRKMRARGAMPFALWLKIRTTTSENIRFLSHISHCSILLSQRATRLQGLAPLSRFSNDFFLRVFLPRSPSYAAPFPYLSVPSLAFALSSLVLWTSTICSVATSTPRICYTFLRASLCIFPLTLIFERYIGATVKPQSIA